MHNPSAMSLEDIFNVELKDRAPYDLFAIAYYDATVANFIKAWQKGMFESWEAMLLALALQLCKEKVDFIALSNDLLATAGQPSGFGLVDGSEYYAEL